MKTRSHSNQTFFTTLIVFCFCGGILNSVCEAQFFDSRKPKESASVKLAKTQVKLLMESTKYQELQKITKRWEATKPELKKQIILNLLGRLNSKQKLTLGFLYLFD